MNEPHQPLSGIALPQLITEIPGPGSRQLAERLRAVESANITALTPTPPIFWSDARGANVRDVDGNIFIDLTAGFGVTHAGHANHAVTDAIAAQARLLPHALGDVYPAEIKVRLLEHLARIAPDPLRVSILANSGAEAVEAALKTAMMRTHRRGIIAFRDSYHGLTYGALAVTHRAHFRDPFAVQLWDSVHFVDFPHERDSFDDLLADIDVIIAREEIGAIIIEPIQGRGGIVVPPDAFLRALRERCDGKTCVLIFDEVYTGCGRTGKWFACEHSKVTPDLLVIGKALTGSLPLSACIGSDEVMSAWPPSSGEAIHTTTFLGNPVACAAAIAQLDQIEKNGLLGRAQLIGDAVKVWGLQNNLQIRGRGALQGVVLASGHDASQVCHEVLKEGVLVLPEGSAGNVLAVTPPAVITDHQLSFALSRITAILSAILS